MTQAVEEMRAKCEAIVREQSDRFQKAAANPREVEPQWCLEVAEVLTNIADAITALKSERAGA